MDIEQLVKNSVYKILSERVQANKTIVSYHDFVWHLNQDGVQTYEPDGDIEDDKTKKVLHECIHELLIDKVLMLVPSKYSFRAQVSPTNPDKLLAFQITSHGEKCIREGIIKPVGPNLHEMFDSLKLHRWVVEVSQQDFKSGHYDQAIFEAYKMIANKVKEKTGLEADGGQGLMGKVFSDSNPKLALNNLVSESDKNEQKGFMFLFMGAMTGIRNPPAHDSPRTRDPYETLHYLAFASILAEKVEQADLR